MKPKNISYQSSKLLHHLIVDDRQFFTIEDAAKILSSNTKGAVRELLRDMVERGLILRLKYGQYCIIPYERDSSTYFPDWHLVADALVQNKDYYIGFYSALDIHNLITQPSLKEQVITYERIRPKAQKIINRHFEFITLRKNQFFGFEKTWIDDYHKINCSDLEKTLIDCFYLPGYATGIIEIAKALFGCRDKINEDRLIDYARRFKKQSVVKRMGYISENLNILPYFIKKMKSYLSSSYIVLDPSLPTKGKSHSNWKVYDNVGIENITNSLKT